MAITGTHVVLYTPEAEAVRETFRDLLGWKYVDPGDGWLIFALPPAELGVHPSAGAMQSQLSFICDDLEGTLAGLRQKGIEVRGEPEDMGFGVGATIGLPGGVEVLVYEPRHPTAAELERT